MASWLSKHPAAPRRARYPILAEQESFTHPEKEWR